MLGIVKDFCRDCGKFQWVNTQTVCLPCDIERKRKELKLIGTDADK